MVRVRKFAPAATTSNEFFSGRKSLEERHRVPILIEDLSYEIEGEKKQTIGLLASVTTFFQHGKLSAIMGPSGAGKTTLLDICACRKTRGVIKRRSEIRNGKSE